MAPSQRLTLNRTESMQRLQLLSSQKEVLQRRVHMRLPSPPPFTSTSPEYRSLSSSPTTCRDSSDFYPAHSWSPELTTSAAGPIPSEPSAAHPHSIDAQSHIEDAHKLREINEQIKATLTELLNTDSVRSDIELRSWVQDKLMDVEQQIRKQRRRHSSELDRQFARKISLNLSPETSFEGGSHPVQFR